MLYQGKGWQGYLVDSAGYLRWYPDLTVDDMPASIPKESKVMNCTRQGINHLGVEALTIDLALAKGTQVFIAYSRVPWTPAVRKLHKADPLKRMQAIASFSGAAFAHAVVLSQASLEQHVTNYKPGATARFNALAAKYAALADRSGSSATLPTRTLAMSGALKQPGLVMALWDPVGITRELGAQRNAQVAVLAKAAGIGAEEKAVAERAGKRLIAEVIEGLLKNAEANPGPLWDRTYGPDRYKKHIDVAAWQTARQDSSAFTAAKSKAERLSKDYVAWFAAPAGVCRAYVLHHDYDLNSTTASAAHERDVADTTFGAGTTLIEMEKVWWPALVKQASDYDSWFYRAICGSHRGVMAFINEEKQWDKAFDGPMLAEAIVRELYEHSVQQLINLHGTVRYLRPANEHTKELVDTVSTMLLKMQADPKMRKRFGTLVGRVSTALMVRADTVPKGFKISGYKQSIAMYIQKAISGDTKATLSGLANAQRVAGSVSVSNGVTGAAPVDMPVMSKQEADQTAAFLVMRLKNRKLNVAYLKELGLDQLAKLDLHSQRARSAATAGIDVRSMENPYVENYAARKIAKLDAGFAAGALFFQMVAFAVAMDDLTNKKSDSQKRADGVVGLSTAVLSGTAAIMEIRAAVLLMNGATKGGVQGLVRIGAVLGGAANVIEGAYLVFWKGPGKRRSGDEDSGLWTIGSGVALMTAGVTGIVGGAFVVGTVPVIGWALVTLGLLGLSIYCAINASSTDDDNLTPVEYWLDNGSFGRRKKVASDKNPYLKGGAVKTLAPWSDARAEIVALQEMLLVVQAEVSTEPLGINVVLESWFSSNADITRYFSVDLPRWSASSRVVVQLHATTVPQDGQQRFMALQFEYAGGDNDGLTRPRTGAASGAAQNSSLAEIIVTPTGSGTFWKHQAIVSRAEAPEIKVDRETAQMRLYSRVDVLNTIKVRQASGNPRPAAIWTTELTVQYWPDELDLPELKLQVQGIKEQITVASAHGY